MTVREKAELIVKDIKKEQGTNPVVIFKQIAEKEYISIHGSEHHILDGASLLVAYKKRRWRDRLRTGIGQADVRRTSDAGSNVRFMENMRSNHIHWRCTCNHRRNRSAFNRWNMGNHMQFTSKAIGELGAINRPRCCKRDAMIAFKNGIDYVDAHYGVTLQYEQMQCGFTDFNEQCIKERCPFHE